MAKRRANMTLDHWKSGIGLIYLCIGGVAHIIQKLSTRPIILLEISPQLEVCAKSYGPQKLQGSQFKEFWDPRGLQVSHFWKCELHSHTKPKVRLWHYHCFQVINTKNVKCKNTRIMIILMLNAGIIIRPQNPSW
jgi:hypothetical protein